MESRGMATAMQSIRISPTGSSTRRPFTTVGVGKGSVPVSSTDHKQGWPVLMKRALEDTHLGPFLAYSTNTGAVNHWKKLAKKAEFELLLERDSHRSDNSKNNSTIHRINRRLIPLEKALGKTKETVKYQEKLISHLKSQLLGIGEKNSDELSFFRSQADTLQKRLVGVTQVSDQKVQHLQEELHQAELRTGILQAQMNEIYKNMNEASELEDFSHSREGSADSPLDGKDSKKDAKGSDKGEKGTVVLAKIHKMNVIKLQFERKLKKNEDQVILMVEDNERLKRLAQEAVSRSNKLMELVHNLKADRDWTMSRLKETEDIIKSLEAFKDLVLTYVKTTSPRIGNLLPGALLSKPTPTFYKKAEHALEIENIDHSHRKAGSHPRIVYFKDDIGQSTRTLGVSLLKKLQEVFQALALKVETATHATKMVKKESEEMQGTMLEAFQELRGQRTLKLNSPDDVALGVLLAVREVKQTVEVLKKEKAFLRESGSVEAEKFLQLQSQVHELSLDRLALLETLEAVKSTIRATGTGQGALQYVKAFFKRTVIQGEDITYVLEMVERLVKERNEATSMSGAYKEETFTKEREVSDLRKLHAQSQTLAAHMQAEKDLLKKERNELKATCQVLTKEKMSWDYEAKAETDKKLQELQNQVHDLVLNRTALLETLEAIKEAVKGFNSGHCSVPIMESLERGRVQGVKASEVVEIVEKLVKETQKSEHNERQMREEKESTERELDETRTLYAQSQAKCDIVEKERDSMKLHIIELGQGVSALRTERDSFKFAASKLEESLSQFQTQVHDLSQERSSFLATVEALRNLLGSPTSGEASIDSKHLLNRPIQADLVDMAKKLVHERNEARSGGRNFKEEKEIKEIELSESKILCQTLHEDKVVLEREVNDLQNSLRSIEGILSGSGPSHPLNTKSLVNDVLAIKHNVDAAKIERGHFEKTIHDMMNLIGNTSPSSDWKSDAAALFLSLQAFAAEKGHLATALREIREIHIGIHNDLLKVMRPAEGLMKEGKNLSDVRKPLRLEDMSVANDFSKVAADLQELVDEIRELKSEKDRLTSSLQSVELEKEAAARRSSEHHEKLLQLSDNSLQEVNDLRDQLNMVQSFTRKMSVNGAAQSSPSEAIAKQQDIRQKALLGELEAIDKELTELRAKEMDLEITVSELLLQGSSEQEMVQELGRKLSSTESELQTLIHRSSISNARVQSLESQHSAAEAHLSELFTMIISKDLVQSSSSEVQHMGTEIVDNIKAIKRKVLELQLAKDEVINKGTKDANSWKAQVEALKKEGKLSSAEVERMGEKLGMQGEFIKKQASEWAKVVESLKAELVRLGGSDPKDEGDKLRRSRAAEKVKEVFAPTLRANPPVSNPQASTSTFRNPLLSLAKFQVDLLVNSKVHSQLKVAGHNGGLGQGVLRYFSVDMTTGDITFENAMIPGSQSSNLVVDLFLLPIDDKKNYQTQAGDTLGLCVKVTAFNDSKPREILLNSDILRTDEVIEAIHGQMIQNFSLWPDLVSSWRWERDMKKSKWSLMSIRWRFLLKNVFPDLSSPLQDLTANGVVPSRSSSITIL